MRGRLLLAVVAAGIPASTPTTKMADSHTFAMTTSSHLAYSRCIAIKPDRHHTLRAPLTATTMCLLCCRDAIDWSAAPAIQEMPVVSAICEPAEGAELSTYDSEVNTYEHICMCQDVCVPYHMPAWHTSRCLSDCGGGIAGLHDKGQLLLLGRWLQQCACTLAAAEQALQFHFALMAPVLRAAT